MTSLLVLTLVVTLFLPESYCRPRFGTKERIQENEVVTTNPIDGAPLYTEVVTPSPQRRIELLREDRQGDQDLTSSTVSRQSKRAKLWRILADAALPRALKNHKDYDQVFGKRKKVFGKDPEPSKRRSKKVKSAKPEVRRGPKRNRKRNNHRKPMTHGRFGEFDREILKIGATGGAVIDDAPHSGTADGLTGSDIAEDGENNDVQKSGKVERVIDVADRRKRKFNTYNFQYDTGNDDNRHFRREEKLSDGTIKGLYGYKDPTGAYRIVEFLADHNGYRATTKLLNELPDNFL